MSNQPADADPTLRTGGDPNQTRRSWLIALGLGAVALLAAGSLRLALDPVPGGLPSPTIAHNPAVSGQTPRATGGPSVSATQLTSLVPATTPEPTATTTAAPPSQSPVPTDSPQGSRTTRYVATTGSDSATGTIDAPFLTVQHALDLSAAGDTVILHGGRYDGFDVAAQGTTDAPITVRAHAGETPVIEGPSGRPDVIHVTPDARNVVLEGLTVQGSQAQRGSGVLIENALEGPVVVRLCRILGNAGFGVNVYQSRNVQIQNNDISHNGTGVQVIGEGAGVVVSDNEVHENDRMIRNTRQSVNNNDDYGAVGVALVHTTGAVLVSGNNVWMNRALSYDYGWDGGAFDIYAASNVTIRDNVASDNQTVLETGTDPGLPCDNNRFFGNLAFGNTTSGSSRGVLLRCGAGMLIAYNTLANLDDFGLEVGLDSAAFSGTIDGARVVGNVFVLLGGGPPYRFERARPDDLMIDRNLVWAGGRPLADVAGHGQAADLSQLADWTGYERAGRSGNPLFVNPSNHDYHLRSGSPAIDAGPVIAGVSDVYLGAAPDLGAFESP